VEASQTPWRLGLYMYMTTMSIQTPVCRQYVKDDAERRAAVVNFFNNEWSRVVTEAHALLTSLLH